MSTLLWKRTGGCNRGHFLIAAEVGDAQMEMAALDRISAQYEADYAALAFEYRLGAAILFLSNQILIYSLYLSIVGHNWWGTAYICIFYFTSMTLFGLYDLGTVHDLPPKLFHLVQFVNSVVSTSLTASLWIYLSGLRGNLYAQLGGLTLSLLLNVLDYDSNFRTFLVVNIIGLAFAYTTLSQHLQANGLGPLIASFALSVLVCPLLSQLEISRKFRRYYYIVHSLGNGLEILASTLLMLAVKY